MSEGASSENSAKQNSPTFDSITIKLKEYCNREKSADQSSQKPLKHFSNLKAQLGALCYDVQLFTKNNPETKMTDQIDLLTKRSYEVIEDLSKTIDAETDANTAMQLKKLQADFYRNLSTFVPSEKEKAKNRYMEVINTCSLQNDTDLYISLILDYSCLLANNYNDKQQAIVCCCKLLIEIKKETAITLDSAGRAYLSFVRRNVLLWKKQIGK